MTVAVLIIDDDEARAGALAESLTPYGFETKLVHEPSAGIGAFLAEPFDVVLLPVSAFSGQGLQLAQGIRGCTGGVDVGLVLWAKNQAEADPAWDGIANEVWVGEMDSHRVPVRLASIAHEATGAVCENLVADAPRIQMRTIPVDGTPAPEVDIDLVDVEFEDSVEIDAVGYPDEGELSATITPRDLLLYHARGKTNGVLHFSDGQTRAAVAFVRGMIMGALDTSPETRLGTQLLRNQVLSRAQLDMGIKEAKDRRLRLAEALMGIGLVDAGRLLDELALQAKERAVRVVGFSAGTYRLGRSVELVEQLSIAPVDVVEVLLTWYLRLPERETVHGWLRGQLDSALRWPKEHPLGLDGLRALRPESMVPDILQASPTSVREVVSEIGRRCVQRPPARETALEEFYAAGRAGLFYVDGDGPVAGRRLPLRLRGDGSDGDGIDRELAAEVQTTWLKSQGRNFFDVLGISSEASDGEVAAALERFKERFGPDRLKASKLGPAASLAAGLIGLGAEMDWVLLDPVRRADYAREITATFEVLPPTTSPDIMSELDTAEELMDSGHYDQARKMLEDLEGRAPDSTTLAANLASVRFSLAMQDARSAVRDLEIAHDEAPANVRVLYLLGKAQVAVGDYEAAVKSLSAACRKVPGDVVIAAALADVMTRVAKLREVKEDGL